MFDLQNDTVTAVVADITHHFRGVPVRAFTFHAGDGVQAAEDRYAFELLQLFNQFDEAAGQFLNAHDLAQFLNNFLNLRQFLTFLVFCRNRRLRTIIDKDVILAQGTANDDLVVLFDQRLQRFDFLGADQQHKDEQRCRHQQHDRIQTEDQDDACEQDRKDGDGDAGAESVGTVTGLNAVGADLGVFIALGLDQLFLPFVLIGSFDLRCLEGIHFPLLLTVFLDQTHGTNDVHGVAVNHHQGHSDKSGNNDVRKVPQHEVDNGVDDTGYGVLRHGGLRRQQQDGKDDHRQDAADQRCHLAHD